jgi:hypothetical protein
VGKFWFGAIPSSLEQAATSIPAIKNSHFFIVEFLIPTRIVSRIIPKKNAAVKNNHTPETGW